MDIIERAAELLRTSSQGHPKTPTGANRNKDNDNSLIQRAAEGIHGGSGFPEAGSARQPGVARPGSNSRTFKIDRGRLQERGMIVPDGKRTAITESFRRIKRQILENAANTKPEAPPANLVLVTSAVAGEGKTFCAINLAISIALEIDRTVLLVDADAAKASIPPALGLPAEKGLMEVLHDRQIDLSEVLWATDIGKLSVLTVGVGHRQHSPELLASENMRALLREMAERYRDRIIIFDSPPLLAASEASVLASQVGQIVVVVEAGKTSEATLKDSLGRLDVSKVAGLLLNKVDGPRLEYGYGAYG